jgi:UDP-N-acetylmuramate dehydrogenase
MTFLDLTPDLKARMPALRGRLLANRSLSEPAWSRLDGPGEVPVTSCSDVVTS